MSLKIAVITSTTRPSRVGRKVADWFLDQVKDVSELDFELIDVAELNLPFLDEALPPSSGKYEHEHTKKWAEKVTVYDGYVWVTAEYNHGYPAPLKNAIDTVYAEWAKKPVAFVGYGGVGGARAIEQLVNVAAQLEMVALSGTAKTVRIMEVWSAFDDDGTLKPEFIKGSVQGLVDELTWWAATLKQGREAK